MNQGLSWFPRTSKKQDFPPSHYRSQRDDLRETREKPSRKDDFSLQKAAISGVIWGDRRHGPCCWWFVQMGEKRVLLQNDLIRPKPSCYTKKKYTSSLTKTKTERGNGDECQQRMLKVKNETLWRRVSEAEEGNHVSGKNWKTAQ